MVKPATFITIGGVRYHKDSVVNHSETLDNKGHITYNVTLEGGTKISYPKQGKSGEGYTVDFFRRGATNGKISRVTYRGSQQPLILADKPIKDNLLGNEVSISIFGLKNAIVQGNPDISEDLHFTNCQNNTVYLNEGNDVCEDSVWMHNDDSITYSNKNNTVYLDELDFDDYYGDKPTHGNKIIRDNE